MSNHRTSLNRPFHRRVLLKGALAGAAAVLSRGAAAAPAQPALLAPDDPQAAALGYVEDATTVDVATWPKKAGPGGDEQHCANCALYQPGENDVGGCGIFPGKLVKAAGWCNAWVPKG